MNRDALHAEHQSVELQRVSTPWIRTSQGPSVRKPRKAFLRSGQLAQLLHANQYQRLTIFNRSRGK